MRGYGRERSFSKLLQDLKLIIKVQLDCVEGKGFLVFDVEDVGGE